MSDKLSIFNDTINSVEEIKERLDILQEAILITHKAVKEFQKPKENKEFYEVRMYGKLDGKFITSMTGAISGTDALKICKILNSVSTNFTFSSGMYEPKQEEFFNLNKCNDCFYYHTDNGDFGCSKGHTKQIQQTNSTNVFILLKNKRNCEDKILCKQN